MVDIISRVAKILADQGVDDKKIEYIDKQLRHEYAGSFIYVAKRPSSLNERIIERIRTSKDFRAIAKEFNVCHTTVYRLYHRSRYKK